MYQNLVLTLKAKVMTALEFIKLKQKSWAERKGFTLLPGTIANEDGDKIYFDDYNKNLYY